MLECARDQRRLGERVELSVQFPDPAVQGLELTADPFQLAGRRCTHLAAELVPGAHVAHLFLDLLHVIGQPALPGAQTEGEGQREDGHHQGEKGEDQLKGHSGSLRAAGPGGGAPG